MVFRSLAEKEDIVGSWRQPERPFFATGACHVLAQAFLWEYPAAGFGAFYLRPREGFRGGHVFVSDGDWIFDYHGYCRRDRYLSHMATKLRRFFPGWEGEVIPIEESTVGPGFCRGFGHREPHQFLHDPLPRALAFLRRFPTPDVARLTK